MSGVLDSLTWYLQGRADFGRFHLKNARFTDAAKKLIGKPAAFKNAFGTQFIDTER
jgi:hypothetical protein